MYKRIWLVGVASAMVTCSPAPQVAGLDARLARQISTLKTRVNENPDNAALQLELAEAYLEAKSLFEAANTAKTVTELDPSRAKAFAVLAQIYLQLGYGPSAIAAIDQCMRLDRYDPDCLFVTASVLRQEGNPEMMKQAEVFLRDLIAKHPDYSKIKEAKRTLHEIEALSQRAATENVDTNPKAEPKENPHEASASSQPAISPHKGTNVDPDAAVGGLNAYGLLIQKAFNAVKTGKLNVAETAFREAYAMHPDDPGVMAGLAQTLLQEGKNKEAIDLAKKAYQQMPNNSDARWIYGLVMITNNKNRSEAIRAWEELLRDDPQYAQQLKLQERLDNAKR